MSDVPPGRWSLQEPPKLGLTDPYLGRHRTRAKRPLAASEGVVAVEICCGAAGLSLALDKVGFTVKPVDWKGNRHQPKFPFLKIDFVLCERLWVVFWKEHKGTLACTPAIERAALWLPFSKRDTLA